MATVRYPTGFSGRWSGGGAPGSRGRLGLVVGGGAVRSWFRMKDIFYSHGTDISILHSIGRNSRMLFCAANDRRMKVEKLTALPSGQRLICHAS